MPHFICNLDGPRVPLHHVWSHTVGSGHAALALHANWQRQMLRTHEELGIRFVRFHGILCDQLGTYLVERDQDVYSFFNADQIFDFLIGIGMRPFVELSFMPRALSSGNTTVFSYAANVTVPKSWRKWAGLIQRLVRHWVDRYGISEVRQWYFEVWNEPNLSAFWTGNQADYFKLYRTTVEAIKEVDDQLRVGGPATANDEWVDEFVAFCDKHKLPADFVSTHHYPTDALGKPGDDTEQQLADAHRDTLLERTEQASRAAKGKPLCYTEWSSSSNPFFPRHDEPYAAAFLLKNMLDVADLVECYSWWTFSDIFEENYFSSAPFHGSFGLQTIHGIAKPAWRAMQMLNQLGAERLRVDGAHSTVNAWAILNGSDSLTLLLSNHAFPKHDIRTAVVTFTVQGSHKPLEAWVERIDEDHANPRRAWKDMGSPDYLDTKRIEALHAASQTQREKLEVKSHGVGIDIELHIPPHAIAAVQIQYRPRQA
jgi:xylan 1,4-beta-xylosidase